MRRGSLRVLIAVTAAVTVVLMPSVGAQVSVPPPPDVPPQGRYLEPSFSFSRTRTNAPYGQATNSRNEPQTLILDVYEPDNDLEEFRPAVVWVHGGFFARGSKADVEFLHDLTRRGYVTVPIDYRIRPEQEVSIPEVIGDPTLAPEFIETIQDAQHDALAAIRWVRANAADLRVDPARVIIAGHSAGGLTTFQAVFNHEDEGVSGNSGWPSRPAAGLASAGAYGPGITGRPALPGDAPLLAMHGTNDTTVPMPTSTAPCAQTLAVGNVCEMRIYPGAGHGLPDGDRGLVATSFLYRRVISAARSPTEFTDTTVSTRGETATVMGRLVNADGEPVADARILARANAGWVESTTGEDGTFSLTLSVPEHGRSIDIKLRYEGHYTSEPHLAPTYTVATATWGRGPVL